MNQNIRDTRTDAAWKRLHRRLEEDGLITARRERAPLYKRPAFAIAATVVILIGFSIFSPNLLFKKSTLDTITNIDPQSSLVKILEDGSAVFMSANARLSFPKEFNSNKREVKLSGDAFFDISRDEKRPFIIETGQLLIEVLGTSFNVNSDLDESPLTQKQASVSVHTGRVKVILKSTGKSEIVDAGKIAVVSNGILEVKDSSHEGELFGYLRRVHFKDETLAHVAQAINKYNTDMALDIDRSIGERVITATFSGNSPDSAASMICFVLNLNMTVKDGVIKIHP